ncbi:efflux RND transporter periplasmic adaptor subunit [Ancylomarina sp. 16SWW S1-10-2]|uniref:efflux RND transporter periplasmic adaptor subunit n=1 Tax=Ancylomarina sp. 16SWW S1-10-2 TaxID=2499681 RepID=UPI0012AE06AB|nr:efflux RND transporter periplasmic adaptor subunit [Ancylomarina sp. 16SWW S1-10-2]MRT92797.1 efflux RND transporter periplasmic adaptor subunit [Ancylomarina sp. 16SWW S1-10-2]
MRKMKISRMMVLALFLSVGMFACKDGKNVAKQELVQPVKVFKVDAESSNLTKKVFTGLVKESREVKLAFQIPGPLVKLSVSEGQFVKKGQVVAMLDERDYQVQLASANANYDNAKLQAERYTALFEKKSTSKSVYDQIQVAYKLAKAHKDAAENALNDTKIRAPFSGYVQSLYVENFEKIGAGQPIISLLDLSHLELVVALSENDYLQSKLFTKFQCQFEHFPNLNFDLKLIDIERKPNRDNFYKMRLDINTKKLQIVPGMVASLSTYLKSEGNTLNKIPEESVFSDKGKSYVWKFNPKKECVERKEVKLKSFDSNGMISIENGVSDGDFIVSAGIHNLREGQKVKMLVKRTNSNVGGQL